MEESRKYNIYRTISPLPAECITKYEIELHPVPADGEFRVKIFGIEYKTSRKGKVLKLCRNGRKSALTSLNQIEGFEQLTELTTLDLSEHKIKDISRLTKLKNLKNLYLTNNVGVDLKPLEQMQSLEKLIIGGDTRPCNIQSIGKLKNLTTLMLTGSHVVTVTVAKDISFLKELKKLQDLDLSTNRIEDISPLAGLYNLKKLNLRCNAITDISPLKNLTSLTEIDFYDNKIKDVTALGNLFRLNHLMLNRNCIHDITPLTNLKNLQYLYLMENPVEDFWPLEKLQQKILIAPSKKDWPAVQKTKAQTQGTAQPITTTIAKEQSVVVDGKTFTTTNQGTILDLGYDVIKPNKIKQISSLNEIQGLEKLENLKKLNLYHQGMTDISMLTRFKNLIDLDLSLCKNVTDFSCLGQLKNLQSLRISHCQITDISWVAGLDKLTILHLSSNKIQDIKALSDLKELRNLGIAECQIQDITPLRNFKNLEFLMVSSMNITSFEVLKELKTLKQIVIYAERTYKVYDYNAKNLQVVIEKLMKEAPKPSDATKVQTQNTVRVTSEAKKTEEVAKLVRVLAAIADKKQKEINTLINNAFQSKIINDIVNKAAKEAESAKKIQEEKLKKSTIAAIRCPQITRTGAIFKTYTITWDCIFLGHYPQDKKKNGTFPLQPIRWRVLDIKDGTAVLLADRILDAVKFEIQQSGIHTISPVQLRYNTIRNWLNHTFMENAFSEKERSALVGMPYKVDLLSQEHLVDYDFTRYGFNYCGKHLRNTWKSLYSDYAAFHGINAEHIWGDWLIGTNQKNGAIVDWFGTIPSLGIRDKQMVGLRPLIIVDLNALDKVAHDVKKEITIA